MHVLVTRPEPDALKLKGMLEARGHEATVEPLMSVSYEGFDQVDLEGVTGIIATSRYALMPLANLREQGFDPRTLTVFAVGGATARVARQMGFGTVVTGAGTAAALVPLIVSTFDPADEVLLHLAGERISLNVAEALVSHGFRASTANVYRMLARTSFTDATRDMLADNVIDTVMLMSSETAAIYARLAARAGLQEAARSILHVCLSDGIARRLAVLGDVPSEVADQPNLEEMLALVDAAEAKSLF